MKRKDSLAEPPRPRLLLIAGRGKFRVFVLLLSALPLAFVNGAQLKQARVSQVVQDVKLLPGQAAPRPAKVTDEVREGTAVRTGIESRSELTFPDQTLARLGANTIFSFNEGTRNLDLQGGAMLLRVPKNAGGAQIQTAAITAAITGTTIMLEYHPNAFSKFIVLEGTGRIFRRGHLGESVLVHAGQMLIVNPNGSTLPEPVDVDLERLMKTSVLITGFPPLLSTDLIGHEIAVQTERKNEGGLIETNLVIFGGGTTVDRLDPTQATVVDQANSNEMRQDMLSPTPTPSESPSPTVSPTITPTVTPTISPTVTPTISPTVTPTPSKFGTPTVISSPVPYVIGSGTTITTDPTITTNGATDFGKQYRSPHLDGAASTFLFGSTSAFDTQIGFDGRLADPDTLPGAVFKFQSLRLAGNPTISLNNSGVPNLALISVGDLISGVPGGVLTFDGIDAMLLATQDGSITLGSEISFEGISRLFLYARGTGSTLTLDSAISGSTDLTLISEGDIVFNNEFNLTESEPIDNGLHFELIANTDLRASNGLTITLDNSNGSDTLDQSATISLSAGQDFTIEGDPGLNLTIANNGGGHIGGNALIDVFPPTGNLTASAINLLINDRDGGSIDGLASIVFEVGGALNVDNDMTMVISTRNGGVGRDTNGVNLAAASIFAGGFIDLAISANAGGVIPGAILFAEVPGSVVANGGYFSEIQSTGFSVPGGPFVKGGMITDSASIELFFGTLTSGDVIDVEIDNFGAGTIIGDALLSVGGIFGGLNATGDIVTDIINTAVQSGNTIIPGGTINGNATVDAGAFGNIITSGVGEFAVLNNDLNFLSQAGTITGDANVNLSAANITTGGFFQPLVNNTNGTIGGSANVFVTATGDVNVGAETFFNILNTGGTIGGEAFSILSANNFTTATTFQFQILNDGGSIGGTASLFLTVADSLTVGGDAFIQITNEEGDIGGDAFLYLTAGSFSANSLLLKIDSLNGTIGGDPTITLNATGMVTTTGDATVDIDLTQEGGLPKERPATVASIDLNGGSYSVGGTFHSTITGVDGGITVNTSAIAADIVKIGAFGDNGSLTIGGGRLSGSTELKLYAPGSNGQVNFISNVTLDSESSAIIAANAVTINSGVTVTIAGDDGVEASVFTNVPNYTGSGGNGKTTGKFDGNGATTAPLASAPPFDDPGDKSGTGSSTSIANNASVPKPNSASPGERGGGAAPSTPRGKRYVPIARVANSTQLLDLADKVTSAPTEAGHARSGAPNGRTSRGPGSVSLGKGRVLTPVPDADRASLTLNRGLARPALLP